MKPTWQPWLLALALFLLNACICRELVLIESVKNLDSNEGFFTAVARFYREYPFERWSPWFSGGMPTENTYQPLLPMFTALTARLSGLSDPRSLHLVLALAYCLGPVTLFCFAGTGRNRSRWRWGPGWRISCSRPPSGLSDPPGAL